MTPNQPLSVLPNVNVVPAKVSYDRKVDTLQAERYHRAIETDNWDVIFDEENNEL